MDVQRKHIPNMLKRYRKLAGYSQKEVAIILGFKSTARISSWERGNKLPSIQNQLALSNLYSTLPAELFCDLNELQKVRIRIGKQRLQDSKGIEGNLT